MMLMHYCRRDTRKGAARAAGAHHRSRRGLAGGGRHVRGLPLQWSRACCRQRAQRHTRLLLFQGKARARWHEHLHARMIPMAHTRSRSPPTPRLTVIIKWRPASRQAWKRNAFEAQSPCCSDSGILPQLQVKSLQIQSVQLHDRHSLLGPCARACIHPSCCHPLVGSPASCAEMWRPCKMLTPLVVIRGARWPKASSTADDTIAIIIIISATVGTRLASPAALPSHTTHTGEQWTAHLACRHNAVPSCLLSLHVGQHGC